MRLFPKDRDLTQPVERVELRVRASDLNLPMEEVHVRLDAFLQRALPWRSRTSIQGLVKNGYVLVDAAAPDRVGDGELVTEYRPGRRLLHGSRVVVIVPEPLRIQRATSSAGHLHVLYEDDVLIGVDKPPGLPVHPSGRHLSDTLIQRVYAHWNLAEARREDRIKLCHRLDRETSGVVLLARDPVSHAAVMRQFEEREVTKEYLAIVRGVPQEDGGTIDVDLGPAVGSQVRLKMAPVARGLPSRTDWRVLERFDDCALVLCRLHTGRQHQIRVHMAAIGLPLVGDKLYGEDEELFLRAQAGDLTPAERARLGLARHALHAHRLVVTSPTTGLPVEITSPLPEDLAQYLAKRPRIDDRAGHLVTGGPGTDLGCVGASERSDGVALDAGEMDALLRVLARYGRALELLDDYDHQRVREAPPGRPARWRLGVDEARRIVARLKREFGAPALFGREKDAGLEAALGAVEQTIDGADVYATLEQKAAHLLYFLVKNHAFVDGNKRIAAALFLCYLERNGALLRPDGTRRVSDAALVATTLLIAESRPADRELIVGVVVQLLRDGD